MEYKLIAVDMDGTLCNDEKVIPKENIEALISLQQSGKKVALATGRPEGGILPFIKELRLEEYGGFVISYNGGKIYDAKNKKCLFSVSFPREEIKTACRILREENSGLTLTVPLSEKIYAWGKVNPHTYDESKIVKMPLYFKDDLYSALKDISFCKLLFTGENEECNRMQEIFRKIYRGKFEVFKSEKIFLEITPLGVNKGNALKALCEITGIKRGETIACGDNFNDIEMIKYAGLGVAMANAVPEVKKYADALAPSNNSAGVAETVKKYML